MDTSFYIKKFNMQGLIIKSELKDDSNLNYPILIMMISLKIFIFIKLEMSCLITGLVRYN